MTTPISLRLKGRKVLVAGAGTVATRRVRTVLADEADVHVVAPDASEEIASLADSGEVTLIERAYRASDLDGAWLVFAHTGSPDLDARIAAEAEEQRIWCVQGGAAEQSKAWMPAVADAGDIRVAVNAGGDPRRAVALRDAIKTALICGELPLRRHRRPRGASSGSVALIGAGPGDVELITVRGRRLVAEADVVVIDRLAPQEIVRDLAADVEVIDVGKQPGHHRVSQDGINELLADRARAGLRVARVKGGDPYVLGRGGEEAAYLLERSIEVEVVPGVTSAVSVAAAAGIPVTHRSVAKSFTVVSGHTDLDQLSGSGEQTVVLLMGVATLRESAHKLIAGGRPETTPAAIVERGFAADQRTTTGTLANIADLARERRVENPAVIVIGDVVGQAGALGAARCGSRSARSREEHTPGEQPSSPSNTARSTTAA